MSQRPLSTALGGAQKADCPTVARLFVGTSNPRVRLAVGAAPIPTGGTGHALSVCRVDGGGGTGAAVVPAAVTPGDSRPICARAVSRAVIAADSAPVDVPPQWTATQNRVDSASGHRSI